MRTSLQIKLLAMCIFLIALSTISISATYYALLKKEKHQESEQRIQIAFDTILHDLEGRVKNYITRANEFLKDNLVLLQATYKHSLDSGEQGTIIFLADHFQSVSNELRQFGRVAFADRVMLYGENKLLLALYEKTDATEHLGAYLVSAREGERYLDMNNALTQSELMFRRNNISAGYINKTLAKIPLPDGVTATFEGEFPDVVSYRLVRQDGRLGIRIVAPIYRRETKTGALVGEVFYNQHMVNEYASLTKTAVNFFAEHQFSLGTLKEQQSLAPDAIAAMMTCDALQQADSIPLQEFSAGGQSYRQGQCALTNQENARLGAITISLSQAIERQAIRKIFTAVILVTLVVAIVAIILAILFSRATIRELRDIMTAIASVAEGDLRASPMARTNDEIGMLAVKLTQMITQIRAMSWQVQQASSEVHSTADVILTQMDTLIRSMEQQSSSVGNTSTSIEKITHFIESIARNTQQLLSTSSEILSSIQQTRASIIEVTSSTEMLARNLHQISSAVEQVNGSVKQISTHTGDLNDIARETEQDLHRIEQSFKEVTQNATETQRLAKETMESALAGQVSVDASLQGISELKNVVNNTADIIREVNSWGEQVSSILDIVDEITEQTSLLALNASIISAQAGSHGRGFAVVADEIKELAVKTRLSTSKIGKLVHELHAKSEKGVQFTQEGMRKAEQGMELTKAVKNALTAILERATISSDRAANTVGVIQNTANSNAAISALMRRVTAMVGEIRSALEGEAQDVEQIMSSVESLSGMSEQISRASQEQRHAADDIAARMEMTSEQFESVTTRTEELQQSANHIVSAIHAVESTTETILQNAVAMSENTVKNLTQQSDILQKVVSFFKIT